MIKIADVSIEASEADVLTRNAVFTITFESNLKAMVCHAFNETIHEALLRLISLLKKGVYYGEEAAQALKESAFIMLKIEQKGFLLEKDLVYYKFRLIKKYDSIFPNGYNLWPIEYRVLGLHKSIVAQVFNAINSEDNSFGEGPKLKKGRKPKTIYQYALRPCGNSTEWACIKAWEGTPSILQVYPNWSAGNISSACNNSRKVAYGFKWSYLPDMTF